MNENDLSDRLARYLESIAGGPVTITFHDPPGSGFSADNMIFSATVAGHTTKHLLRRDSTDDSPYPEQATGLGTGVFLQASVMRALDGVVPVAKVVALEADPGVLGVPFMIMDFVDGVVPIEYPPCTTTGFYADAAPAVRTNMIGRGLETLARVHSVPWRDRGLCFLHPHGERAGAARQLDLWCAQLNRGLRGRRALVFDRAVEVLASAAPATPPVDDIVLSWGDARLGNVIWDGTTGEPLCVTDFEGAAVGQRELDLGWWLLADRWMHEGSGAPRLDGEPTRSEQVEIYEQAAGVRVGAMRWFELFAAFRFATSVVSVMNRWVDEGKLPGDHTIWRDNPATALIEFVIEDTASAFTR